jgi:hypothetical protein
MMTRVIGIQVRETNERCGGTWYVPRFHGHRIEYVVVAPPG